MSDSSVCLFKSIIHYVNLPIIGWKWHLFWVCVLVSHSEFLSKKISNQSLTWRKKIERSSNKYLFSTYLTYIQLWSCLLIIVFGYSFFRYVIDFYPCCHLLFLFHQSNLLIMPSVVPFCPELFFILLYFWFQYLLWQHWVIVLLLYLWMSFILIIKLL